MALAMTSNLIRPKINTVLMSALITTLALSGCSKEKDDAAQSNQEVAVENNAQKGTATIAGDEASVNKLLTNYADMAGFKYRCT